jgi:hypothetical protein
LDTSPFCGGCFADLSQQRRRIVPGVGHIGITVTPDEIAAVRKSFSRLTAPATG